MLTLSSGLSEGTHSITVAVGAEAPTANGTNQTTRETGKELSMSKNQDCKNNVALVHTPDQSAMAEMEQKLGAVLQAASAGDLEGIGRVDIELVPQVLYGIKVCVYPKK